MTKKTLSRFFSRRWKKEPLCLPFFIFQGSYGYFQTQNICRENTLTHGNSDSRANLWPNRRILFAKRCIIFICVVLTRSATHTVWFEKKRKAMWPTEGDLPNKWKSCDSFLKIKTEEIPLFVIHTSQQWW